MNERPRQHEWKPAEKSVAKSVANPSQQALELGRIAPQVCTKPLAIAKNCEGVRYYTIVQTDGEGFETLAKSLGIYSIRGEAAHNPAHFALKSAKTGLAKGMPRPGVWIPGWRGS